MSQLYCECINSTKGTNNGEPIHTIELDNESISATTKRKEHPVATVTPTKVAKVLDEPVQDLCNDEGCVSVISISSSTTQSIKSNSLNATSSSKLILKLMQIQMTIHKLTQTRIKSEAEEELYCYFKTEIDNRKLYENMDPMMCPITYPDKTFPDQDNQCTSSKLSLPKIKFLTKDIDCLFAPKYELSPSLVEFYISW